jgi:hypothetical protein
VIHKVSELEGTTLDMAVAKALGQGYGFVEGRAFTTYKNGKARDTFRPHQIWEHAGPIIQAARIAIDADPDKPFSWTAAVRGTDDDPDPTWIDGKTPLVAAMRAYVEFKLGGEVELP